MSRKHKNLNATAIVIGNKKAKTTRHSTLENYTSTKTTEYKISNHMRYEEAYQKRNEIPFNPSLKDKLADVHSKYVFEVFNTLDFTSLWKPECDMTKEELDLLLVYKMRKRLSITKVLTLERKFTWSENPEKSAVLDTTMKKTKLRSRKPQQNTTMNNSNIRKVENNETLPPKKCKTSDGESEVESASSTTQYRNLDLGRINIENMKFIGHLGEGGQAKVYEAKDRLSGKIYALKVFNKKNKLQDILDETVILQSVKHPCVINLEEQAMLNGEIVHILEKGSESLYDQLNHGTKFDVQTGSKMLSNVISGLCYLHAKCGMHRDIKPENILRVGSIYKITDFGIFTKKRRSMDKVGTAIYMAPEIDGETEYDSKVDLYSLGVVAIEAFTGSLFSDGDDITVARDKITLGLALDFVYLLTEYNPSFRPSAEGIKYHPLITREHKNQDWKMSKIKLQLKQKLKDSNVAYHQNDTVEDVSCRVKKIFRIDASIPMRFVVSDRTCREAKLRNGSLSDPAENFSAACSVDNIRMVFQKISGMDDENCEKMAVRVKYVTWGTIPKIIFLKDGVRVSEIMEQLFDDYLIAKEDRESYELFVNERLNGQEVRTKLLPSYKCVLANISKNKYLILENKLKAKKPQEALSNETIL